MPLAFFSRLMHLGTNFGLRSRVRPQGQGRSLVGMWLFLEQLRQGGPGIYAGKTVARRGCRLPGGHWLETKRILNTQFLDSVHCRRHC